ncbi:MAG: cytochrome c biogenesis protein ResB [Bacteroidaceae bacterium]|nr:cytochrome c biogenesis protein ResB [Bacteroidaceae bacterium]
MKDETRDKTIERKPWNLLEGFAIGAVLIGIGLILQWTIGPVVWSVFSWPVNGITLALFLLAIVLMTLLAKQCRLFRFLSTQQVAIPTLVYAVVLTIVMGLTQQKSGGRGIDNMLTYWPFVLIYALMAIVLGMVCLRRLLHFRFSIANLQFMAFHLGLFIVLLTATLGNADMQRLKLITFVGQIEWRGVNEENRVVETPLAIELKRFIMETYDNGQPKRYASEIVVRTKSGDVKHAIVDVNKPVRINGWKIYQYGYDTQKGAQSQMSILELVRDPWLPAVYSGIYLMLFGALLMFMRKGRKEEKRR